MSYRFADTLMSTSFERTYATPPLVATGSFALSTATVSSPCPALSRTMIRAPNSRWLVVGYVIIHQAWMPSVVMNSTPGGGGISSVLVRSKESPSRVGWPCPRRAANTFQSRKKKSVLFVSTQTRDCPWAAV